MHHNSKHVQLSQKNWTCRFFLPQYFTVYQTQLEERNPHGELVSPGKRSASVSFFFRAGERQGRVNKFERRSCSNCLGLWRVQGICASLSSPFSVLLYCHPAQTEKSMGKVKVGWPKTEVDHCAFFFWGQWASYAEQGFRSMLGGEGGSAKPQTNVTLAVN